MCLVIIDSQYKILVIVLCMYYVLQLCSCAYMYVGHTSCTSMVASGEWVEFSWTTPTCLMEEYTSSAEYVDQSRGIVPVLGVQLTYDAIFL